MLWVSDSKYSPVVKVLEHFVGNGFRDGEVELLGVGINSYPTLPFGTSGKHVHQQPVYYTESLSTIICLRYSVQFN